MADLAAGLSVAVSDPTDSVRSARLVDPTVALGNGNYDALAAALSRGEVEVVRADQGEAESADWDVVVVYRVKAFCGRLPEVNVSGTRTALSVEIELTGGGDCDALEYDEALAIALADDSVDAHVDATVK